MTTRDERQVGIQAFIDTLTPVERHRVCRALNVYGVGTENERYHIEREQFVYDIEYLVLVHTATGGRKDTQ